jgi:ABC-type Fe3+-hydroxamate transport system substrate-binding protein
MLALTDQIGNTVVLQAPAKRIVSLVPSQTELLYDMGLNAEVLGITKFCVHPSSWFKSKTRIGGTKNLRIDKILALNPDLVIANKEENNPEQVLQLMQHMPVYTSDVQSIEQALGMIEDIGLLTDKFALAQQLISNIESVFENLPANLPAVKVAYLIWYNPMMVAGGDTFISHMLQRAGLHNCFGQCKRYPQITEAALKDSGAEVVLLSTEPFPFGQTHVEALSQLMPQKHFALVDGEMFSWYGSRLLHAAGYLHALRQQLS